MSRYERAVAALERRKLFLAAVAGAGFTLLAAGGVALFAPPETLDRLSSLGDGWLALGLAGLFVVSTAVARLLLRDGDGAPGPEVKQSGPPSVEGPDAPGGTAAAPPDAKGYLR